MRSTFGTPDTGYPVGFSAAAERLGEQRLLLSPEQGLGCLSDHPSVAHPTGLSKDALYLEQLYEPTPMQMYLNPTDRSWLRHAAWTLLLLMATWLPASAQLAQRAVSAVHADEQQDALNELLHRYEQRIEFTENKASSTATNYSQL